MLICGILQCAYFWNISFDITSTADGEARAGGGGGAGEAPPQTPPPQE